MRISDWSSDVCSSDLRLSVVPGPFTASFAHAVAGDDATEMADTQDLLGALVAASMLVAEPPPASGPTTYRMLERSEEHTSELQSLMRISYAVFCLKKKT